MQAVCRFFLGFAAIALASVMLCGQAAALEIVLNDVASDRVERQRAFIRNELPLPGTPDLANLDQRLAEKGLARGNPIYIRIFKATSELELWMGNKGGTFTLLARYPICHWTGSVGPKLKEGDKQSPEGFYSIGWPQTRLVGRWRKAFNVGFPNRHDQLLDRTGSYILIHGGCSSVGCFAMTNQVQNEIYELANAALSAGQKRFDVHIFPFRMTSANMSRFALHPWAHTWADMKPAYESFERTHIPPKIVVCGVRYQVSDGLPGETGSAERHMPVLRPASRTSAGRLDVVTNDEGVWQAPNCDIDDGERTKARMAATANAMAVAADAMAGVAGAWSAPGEGVVVRGSVVETSTKTHAPPHDREVEKSARPAPRPAKSAKRERKPRLAHTPANDASEEVPAEESSIGRNGFGSARLGNHGKIAGGS
ncbi:MAG: murein L,D-transpeptidase family protein [Hyphomicrobiaceae bacterium]